MIYPLSRFKNNTDFKKNKSENLMSVVKEANYNIEEIKKEWTNDAPLIAHYKPFYERVKDQVPDLNFFITICIQDVKYDFVGGAIIK